MKNIVVVLFCLFCFVFDSNCAASVILDNLNPSFVAYFESDNNAGITNHGASIIEGGVNGKTLQLLNNEYIEIDPKLLFSGIKGTLSFWVRPHWTSSVSKSHTFMSFTWKGVENCYFVLSDGWWEGEGGSGFTYFIFDNQNRVKLNVPVHYEYGKWVHFALTWQQGEAAKLYINGVLSLNSEHVVKNVYEISNKIVFGSDKGCYISKNRWADIDLDEIAAFNKVLSKEEIRSLYEENKRYTPLSNDGTISQTRVLCDEDIGWVSASGANDAIYKVKNAHFNMYIPCVWHGGGTRFPSPMAISEPGLNFKDGDPLERIIELAHEREIELHAWFCVAKRKSDIYKEFQDESLPKAFNIHKPEFRKFIVDLIVDTVKRYNVDGIVLDYIRTMGISTSEYSINDYSRRFNRDLLTDIELKQSDYKLEPHLQQWLDDDVEDVVRSISEQIRQIKPNIKISIFGKAIPSVLGTNPEGRQEVEWANKGYLNTIFHMDYAINPDFERIEILKNEIKKNVSVIPVLGNYEMTDSYEIISRNATDVEKLISYSLLRWPEGVGVYWLRSLDESQVLKFSTTIFKDVANPVWPIENSIAPVKVRIVE